MPSGHYQRSYTPIEERLFRHVQKTESCWLWVGAKGTMGHGHISLNNGVTRRLLLTHRVSWEIHNGEIPDGLCVLHKCDVPNCVNPDHLFLGTKADNSADMISKGRQKKGSQLPQTKLTESQVLEIRDATGTFAEIAKRYSISEGHVHAIRHRRSWAHLK